MNIDEAVRDIEGQVMEEIDGVKSYISCFMKWKDSDKDVAKIYLDIATQELEHAKKIHNILATLVPKATPEQVYLIRFMQHLNAEQIQGVTTMLSMNKI